MTLRVAALCLLSVALSVACGDAVGTGPLPVVDGGTNGATDAGTGPAAAGVRWCERAATSPPAPVLCPAAWPPAGQTTVATMIAVQAFTQRGDLETVEQCLDVPAILVDTTPAQRAFVRTCDLRALPMPSCPSTVADGGVCAVRFVSCGWVQAVYRAAAVSGQCW